MAAVSLRQGDDCEVALLSSAGRSVELDAGPGARRATDARAAYVHLRAGRPAAMFAISATHLTHGTQPLFRTAERQDHEQ